jgi:hypothetical protein
MRRGKKAPAAVGDEEKEEKRKLSLLPPQI